MSVLFLRRHFLPATLFFFDCEGLWWFTVFFRKNVHPSREGLFLALALPLRGLSPVLHDRFLFRQVCSSPTTKPVSFDVARFSLRTLPSRSPSLSPFDRGCSPPLDPFVFFSKGCPCQNKGSWSLWRLPSQSPFPELLFRNSVYALP